MSETIGILGAGVMGAGIAQVLALAGHEVRCYDVSADALARAHDVVTTGRFGVRRVVERGKVTEEDAATALDLISFTSDLDAVHDTDVVLEAVPERLDLKIKVFRELDRSCPERTILASNSSGFPISALAAATDRPGKVIGWHWASPVPVMKLAEIVVTPETDEATVETIRRLAAGAGKNPIVVKDTAMAWGYVANRVYFAMVREAQRVVQEGVATREDVDQLMIDTFRWPSGPFGMTKGAGSGWQ